MDNSPHLPLLTRAGIEMTFGSLRRLLFLCFATSFGLKKNSVWGVGEAAANSCFNLKERGRKGEREGWRKVGTEGRNPEIRDIVGLSKKSLGKTQQNPTSPGIHLGFTLVRL